MLENYKDYDCKSDKFFLYKMNYLEKLNLDEEDFC